MKYEAATNHTTTAATRKNRLPNLLPGLWGVFALRAAAASHGGLRRWLDVDLAAAGDGGGGRAAAVRGVFL